MLFTLFYTIIIYYTYIYTDFINNIVPDSTALLPIAFSYLVTSFFIFRLLIIVVISGKYTC